MRNGARTAFNKQVRRQFQELALPLTGYIRRSFIALLLSDCMGTQAKRYVAQIMEATLMHISRDLVQIGVSDRLRSDFDEQEPAQKDIDWLFGGRHLDREVIVPYVLWYLHYKLSLHDLVEMMAKQDLSLAHTTIIRWVKRFTPDFTSAEIVSAYPEVGHGASIGLT